MPARLFARMSIAVAAWIVPEAAQAATVTDDTLNPFYPEERSLGECISSLPKPGCGSEARGGWQQTLLFVIILLALAFIGWRIVRAGRRARRATEADRPTAGTSGPTAREHDG